MKKITAFFLALLIALQIPLTNASSACIAVAESAFADRDIILPQEGNVIPGGLSGGEDINVKYADGAIQGSETKKYTFTAGAVDHNKCGSRYGYDDLSNRSNSSGRKRLYEDMLAAALSFYADSSDVTLTVAAEGKQYLYIASFDFALLGLTSDEALETWIVFRNDNPLYYWISNTVTVSDTLIYLTVSEEYKQGSVREALNAKIEAALAVYEALTKNLTTDFEKALAVHDKICEETTYASDALGNPSSETWAHNIIGVFDNKKAVCEGYAKAYQLILSYIGVDNIFVTGKTGSENHTWNMVKLDDGAWHFVDVTWDDTSVSPDYAHFYFAMGKDKFNETHTANTPEKTKLDFLYALPEASAETFAPVKLYVNGTYSALCKNIAAALALVNNKSAEYRLKLSSYANDYVIPAGTLPEAKSICFSGNFYDKSDEGEGKFYVDKIYIGSEVICSGDVCFENAEVTFYDSLISSATLNIKAATLTLSGSFCSLYAHINGSTGSALDISVSGLAHLYGDIKADEIIMGKAGCSLFSTVCDVPVLTFKDGTTDIGEKTASAFTGIKTVNIPASVSLVSSAAFDKNTKLTSINVAAENTLYASVDGVLYRKNSKGKTEELVAYPAAKADEVYSVAYGIKTIGDNAFSGADKLKKIYVYKNVSSIGDNAFSGADALEAVYIASTVLDISSSAFDEGTSAVIYGVNGSYAQTYADANGIAFSALNEYTYKFLDYDGKVISERTGFKDELILTPPTPSRPYSDNISYTFSGWNGYSNGMKLTGNSVFTAVYNESYTEYTYKFLDSDGNVVKEETVAPGTVIVAPDEIPQKPSDAQFDYIFKGWNGFTEGMTITEDIVFTPDFDTEVRQYTYTFYDEDETTIIKQETVDYGTVIVCPESPTKPAEGAVRYEFKSWRNYSDGMTVTGDAEFVAEYDPKPNMFTYTFYDEDGVTVLKKETVLYGSKIVCPDDPSKAPDGETNYTFVGWQGYKYGMTIKEDVSFTAQYGVFTSPCKYVFYDDDLSILAKGVLESGSVIILPEIPTKADTAEHHWEFAMWYGYTDGMVISEDVEFTAVYEKTVRTYKYTFYDDDRETVIFEDTAPYGTVIVAPENGKDSTQQYTYILTGWENYTQDMILEGDAEFYAQYDVVVNEYTYIFEDYDGTVIKEETVPYGTLIVLPAVPSRKGYVFKSWSGYTADMVLEDDVTFTAEYEVFETEIISSVYATDETGLFLKNIAPMTTYEQFFENIDNVLEVKLFDESGKEITDTECLVGTNMIAKLIAEDGSVLQQLILIIAGDTNGDGKVSITDFIQIKGHLLSGGTDLSGAALWAADYNGDGKVTITDFVQVKAYLLGR